MGLPAEAIHAGLVGATAAFGRQEVVEIEGRRLHIMLCKNPAGANQVLRLLAAIAPPGGGVKIAVLLNDRFADGQDVSWIWDVDYELLRDDVTACWAGGDRGEDIALRLKYAGVDPETIAAEPDLARALDLALGRLPAGATLYALPTYTAMLELRAELARRGAASPFWER
jgi:UDP-N-acetylmuramyl tripeptide synthase